MQPPKHVPHMHWQRGLQHGRLHWHRLPGGVQVQWQRRIWAQQRMHHVLGMEALQVAGVGVAPPLVGAPVLQAGRAQLPDEVAPHLRKHRGQRQNMVPCLSGARRRHAGMACTSCAKGLRTGHYPVIEQGLLHIAYQHRKWGWGQSN